MIANVRRSSLRPAGVVQRSQAGVGALDSASAGAKRGDDLLGGAARESQSVNTDARKALGAIATNSEASNIYAEETKGVLGGIEGNIQSAKSDLLEEMSKNQDQGE